MCEHPDSWGTITINNGATVDMSEGEWATTQAELTAWGVSMPVGAGAINHPQRGIQSVFRAPLTLANPNAEHIATAEGFLDASFGVRGINEMYPHGFDNTHETPRYPYTTWRFGTSPNIVPPLRVTNVTPEGVPPRNSEVPVDTTQITITFNTAVNITAPGTVTLNWTDSTGISHSHTFTIATTNWNSPTNTVLTLDIPNTLRPLDYGRAYTVVIEDFTAAGGTATVGNMEGPYTHRFITEKRAIDFNITKHLQLPEGTVTPDTMFIFDILPYSLNNDTSNAATSTMPDLNRNSSGIPIPFSNTDTATADTNHTVTISNISEYILGTITFPHAGSFVYHVSERHNTFTNTQTEEMIYWDSTIYEVTFVVQNMPDPLGTVFVSAILIRELGAPEETKTDGGTLNFTNAFMRPHDNPNPQEDDTGLRISKETTGDFANKTLYFDFDITIAVPSLITTHTGINTYRAYVVNSTNNSVETTTTNITSGSLGHTPSRGYYIEFSSGQLRTIRLRHNQTLVFVSTHVGARYTAIEIANTNYGATVTVATNGEVVRTYTADIGDNLSTNLQILGQNTNTAQFVNDHVFVPVVGLNVGSFNLALIVAGILGLAVLLETLRRSRKSLVLETLS